MLPEEQVETTEVAPTPLKPGEYTPEQQNYLDAAAAKDKKNARTFTTVMSMMGPLGILAYFGTKNFNERRDAERKQTFQNVNAITNTALSNAYEAHEEYAITLAQSSRIAIDYADRGMQARGEAEANGETDPNKLQEVTVQASQTAFEDGLRKATIINDIYRQQKMAVKMMQSPDQQVRAQGQALYAQLASEGRAYIERNNAEATKAIQTYKTGRNDTYNALTDTILKRREETDAWIADARQLVETIDNTDAYTLERDPIFTQRYAKLFGVSGPVAVLGGDGGFNAKFMGLGTTIGEESGTPVVSAAQMRANIVRGIKSRLEEEGRQTQGTRSRMSALGFSKEEIDGAYSRAGYDVANREASIAEYAVAARERPATKVDLDRSYAAVKPFDVEDPLNVPTFKLQNFNQVDIAKIEEAVPEIKKANAQGRRLFFQVTNGVVTVTAQRDQGNLMNGLSDSTAWIDGKVNNLLGTPAAFQSGKVIELNQDQQSMIFSMVQKNNKRARQLAAARKRLGVE